MTYKPKSVFDFILPELRGNILHEERMLFDNLMLEYPIQN